MTPKFKQEWTTDHRDWYRNIYLNSDHWKELRARKLAAFPKCQRCPSVDCLDVHHINYKSLFDVQLSDLLTLCRPCHAKEHEENGMPVRQKISFENYIPEPALQKIREHREFEKRRNAESRKPSPAQRADRHKRRKRKFRTVSEERWKSTLMKWPGRS